MALYRTVSLSFWTDTKVIDDFTPEDKYFYLYLFTNPHTNLAGCYEISIKQASIETGYGADTISNLIERFEKVHDVIRYSPETKEILLINWHKYNWTSSEKYRKPLLKEIQGVKNDGFSKYLMDVFNGEEVSLGYGIDTKCMDTSNTNTNTGANAVSKKEEKEKIEEIVGYLNEMTGQHYRPDTEATVKIIKTRMKEGFTVEDFKTVIFKKTKQWRSDPEMVKYLRPQTLFSNKFEAYLNEVEVMSKEDAQKRMMENWASQEGDT